MMMVISLRLAIHLLEIARSVPQLMINHSVRLVFQDSLTFHQNRNVFNNAQMLELIEIDQDSKESANLAQKDVPSAEPKDAPNVKEPRNFSEDSSRSVLTNALMATSHPLTERLATSAQITAILVPTDLTTVPLAMQD